MIHVETAESDFEYPCQESLLDFQNLDPVVPLSYFLRSPAEGLIEFTYANHSVCTIIH
jgi:hypothetical protein